MSKMIAIS